MKWGWILIPLVLVLIGQCTGPAEGAQETLCGSLRQVNERLYEAAGEVEVAAWIEQDGTVRWLYANAATDSWTMLAGDGLGARVCTMRGGTRVRVLGVRNGD